MRKTLLLAWTMVIVLASLGSSLSKAQESEASALCGSLALPFENTGRNQV